MKSALPATKQAAGARAAWSPPSNIPPTRPRCSGDAGALGRRGVPAPQKAGDEFWSRAFPDPGRDTEIDSGIALPEGATFSIVRDQRFAARPRLGTRTMQKMAPRSRPQIHVLEVQRPRSFHLHTAPPRPNRFQARGKPRPSGCQVRHCAGTTFRRRGALRTMPLPGSPGTRDEVCSPGYEAGRRRAIGVVAAVQSTTHATAPMVRRWGAVTPRRHSGPEGR